MRAPYPSITGRALVLAAPAAIVEEGVDTQRLFADGMAAASILSHLDRPVATVPLPIAGIPGWGPGNERAAFYDNATIFRPAAEAIDPGSSATDSHNTCAPAPVSSSALP